MAKFMDAFASMISSQQKNEYLKEIEAAVKAGYAQDLRNVNPFSAALTGGAQGIGAGPGAPGAYMTSHSIADAQRYEKERRAEMLASPAYALTLTAAADLWFAKYGDAWVTHESLEDTSVEGVDWKVLARRLAEAGKLEDPPVMYAYRIIE